MTTFINSVSEKWVHEQTTKDGKVFYNVTVPTTLSVSGYGSVSVSKGQIMDARTNGYKNILLGDADKSRKMSIFDGDKYKNVTVTNKEVAEMVKKARTATTSEPATETETEKA